MNWIFAVALLVSGVYMLASGNDLIGAILLVCGILAVIRCILGAVFKVVWRLIRKPLAIILAIVLAAMAITAVPILLSVDSQPEATCDYLIVLGAGVDGDTPSPILQDRINTAYDYLAAHPNAICIATGGKGSDENLSEAQCIYNHLTAMGIDGDRIWLEDQATSTMENFQYSVKLLQEKTGSVPQNVSVLSNEFHLFRASLMAADQGLSPIFVAASTTDIAARINYTMREIFALWKYLIIGG